MEKELLTRKELRSLLGVSAWTIRQLELKGELPRVQMGPQKLRYRMEDVKKLIEPVSVKRERAKWDDK